MGQVAAVQADLLVSARSPEDVLYRDELETLEPREGLRAAHTYTREPPPGWTGRSRCIEAAMLATTCLDRARSASSAGRRRS